jgi:regulator of nucleoside diphosphate kinase
MKYKKLIIEENEFELIKEKINSPQQKADRVHNLSIRRLKKEMENAKILKEEDIPKDVVRINSKITIEIDAALVRNFQIVWPEKSNITQNKLSMLSPMGLALYGYAADDEISWQFPSGTNTIKILKVEQQFCN